MIKLRTLISNDVKKVLSIDSVNEGMDVSAVHQTANSFDKTFVEYIKRAENEHKYRYIKGKWYPYKDPNGKFFVIAYGHKIPKKNLKSYMKGITDEQATKLLMQDLMEARVKAYDDLYSMFGVKIPLDKKRDEIVVDFVYNLGSLKDFPKLARAIVDNDWNTIKREYQRKWKTPAGETRELTKRNNLFADRFFK